MGAGICLFGKKVANVSALPDNGPNASGTLAQISLMHALLKFARGPAISSTVQAAVPELHDAQLAAVCYDHPIGGDCCDFFRVGPTRVLFALLDVAGRRAENRQIVAAVQGAFRSLATTLFAREDLNEADAMVEICLELNRIILDTAERVCSTPAFAGCYNEALGTVSYFNAGHTPGLLADGERVIELPATGLPLGLFSHATPDASIVALEPGDALVLVSRGIVEARHKRREFGLAQVKKNLQSHEGESAQQICAAILDELRQFTGKSKAQNDITVMALSRQSAAKAATATATD